MAIFRGFYMLLYGLESSPCRSICTHVTTASQKLGYALCRLERFEVPRKVCLIASEAG
jgi:hypothetical protein